MLGVWVYPLYYAHISILHAETERENEWVKMGSFPKKKETLRSETFMEKYTKMKISLWHFGLLVLFLRKFLHWKFSMGYHSYKISLWLTLTVYLRFDVCQKVKLSTI